MSKVKTYQSSTFANFSWLADCLVLFKHKLTLFVVFSAIMAYLATIENAQWVDVILLAIGGYCITGAANAINQILEKDYDKLMVRTANRPVAAGRMSVHSASLLSGVMLVLGIFSLALFNTLAALLGTVAVISYAFIYTPLKRFSPIAILIGSLPGALPLLIGNVAAAGYITQLGIFLFLIQFIWQFPHFLAIGWLGFDEYKVAGYKLISEVDGKRDPKTGLLALAYCLLLIPLAVFGYYMEIIGFKGMIVSIVVALCFASFGYELYRKQSRKAALRLMFASLIYLFVALGIVYIDRIF